MDVRELQQHIRNLATIEKTTAPVVSCYIDFEAWRSGNRAALDKSLRGRTRGLSHRELSALHEAVARIDGFLGSDLPGQTRGAAVFARAGDQPFFLTLEFRVPLPTAITVDSVPHIYPLVELRDTYYRYVVMIATEKRVRILAVHVGSVVEDISAELPDLPQRTGREWAKDHYRKHRRLRIDQFFKEQIRIMERMFAAGGYQHLILAGNPRVTSRIGNELPAHLAARLIDTVPASEWDRTSDIVEATIDCFVEREEEESLARVDILLQETSRHGYAVAGTRASVAALAKGQVEVLVLAKGYQPEPGWGCAGCGAIDVGPEVPPACPECGATPFERCDLKEELVRLAERSAAEVEIVNHSDDLMRLGGVGCLLRFKRPKSRNARAA
jgi:peptide subunit release factor 1 (eRF1)